MQQCMDISPSADSWAIVVGAERGTALLEDRGSEVWEKAKVHTRQSSLHWPSYATAPGNHYYATA